MSEELTPPRFPTMLRKMWSGSEVQAWIDENWNRRAQPEPAAPSYIDPYTCVTCGQLTDAPSVAPEPVAWMWRNKITGAKGVYFEDPERFFNIAAKGEYEWTQLFTHPPRAPLTDEQIAAIVLSTVYEGDASTPYRDAWAAEIGVPFARAIEAVHGIRGQG